MTRRGIASALCVFALSSSVLMGCNKDKKEGEDAAADAAPAAVVAAPPVAEAGTDVADAASPVLSASVKAVPVRTAKPAAPDPPICAAARSARARNSPAAPGLEGQCRAAGGVP